MHNDTKAQLEALRAQALLFSAGPSRRNAFLNGLGPIHFAWHTNPVRYGFLLFHWDVIRHFKAVGAPAQFGGVTAFRRSDFVNFGAPYTANVTVLRGDIDALAEFSRELKMWHNGAHMAIETATGLDMMNATTNIHIREFWRLHYFINARFLQKLRNYRLSGSWSIAKTIEHIETNEHASVPRV